MKKQIKIVSVLCFLLVGFGLYLLKPSQPAVSDLVFENVEALAQNESDDKWSDCTGIGSIECRGEKVYVKIDPYRSGDMEDIEDMEDEDF